MKAGFICIVLLFVFSCKPSLPDGILKPDKMKLVLWDISRADELVNYYSIKDSTFKKPEKYNAFYDTVFRLHNITNQEFNKSFQYYQDRPALLKIILDSLAIFAERRQRHFDTILTKKIAGDTSVKKAILPDSMRRKKGPLLPL
jgi:hypothetical protein